MLKNYKELISVLANDAARYQGGVKKSYIINPLFRVVFWYRVVCYFKHKKFFKYTIASFAYLILRHFEYKYGVFLNTNIHIGSGLYIEHGGCIYLNAKYIGNNFSVFHEVTLGVSPSKGKPYVGDNVTVYMGAKIIGPVILNNNCVVGANAVAVKNVDNGRTVVGIPAKPIK